MRTGLRTIISKSGISLTGSAATLEQAEVVVGIALHNQSATVARCLQSALIQTAPCNIAFLLLDDASRDDWKAAIRPLRDERVMVGSGSFGAVWRARNAILDLVDECFPRARWVARLDGDDCFTDVRSLEAAYLLGERAGARFVLGGNRLVQAGQLLSRTNQATKSLMEPGYLLKLLEAMADGTAENELPSCNLVLSTRAGWRYPSIESAEDHWLVAELLIRFATQGAILEAPFYCDYSLSGAASGDNQRRQRYLQARRKLYEAAMSWASGAGV